MPDFEVIVVGGGHAGTEASAMAARLGAKTLLLTSNLDTIGQMSCNPAIGGIAKGTVVREIDALGGLMGRAADRATIQFRMLNRSKGPAVWAPRAQCDRTLYRRAVRQLLEGFPSLELAQGMVDRLLVTGAAVHGVETSDGRRYTARAVIITAGTFLRGRIHIGTDTQIPPGRAGDQPAVAIAQHIEALGLTVARFKTGTPPRVDGRTVDWYKVTRQDGDATDYRFSFYERVPLPRQVPCWITWAGAGVKEIVRRHLNESALYGGAISGLGPRYCPSLEDKIVKFPDAERHQVFLEPEGLDTHELYLNGLRGGSSSGPGGWAERGATHPRPGTGDSRPGGRVRRRAGGRPGDARGGRALPSVHLPVRVPAAVTPGQRAAEAGAARGAARVADAGRAARGGAAAAGRGGAAGLRPLYDDQPGGGGNCARRERDPPVRAGASGERRTAPGGVAERAARGGSRSSDLRGRHRGERGDRAQVRRVSGT